LIKHAIDIGWMKGDPMVGLNRPIIKTEAGIGFTVAGFSDWFRDAITAAGLPLNCKPRRRRRELKRPPGNVRRPPWSNRLALASEGANQNCCGDDVRLSIADFSSFRRLSMYWRSSSVSSV
jgi:hypothetical protein